MTPPLIINPGDQFNRWTVIEEADRNRWGHRRFRCRCRCGNEGTIRLDILRQGRSMSCGCAQKGKKGHDPKHGHCPGGRGTPTYRTWRAMIQRCRYPSQQTYKYYGGRGITICERWQGEHGFETFLADMGERPELRMSLDRIDPNGNYEPDNCRWATPYEQRMNQRPVAA